MSDLVLASYEDAILSQWSTELTNRVIPKVMEVVRACVKCHDDMESVDYDRYYWGKIDELRNELGRDKLESDCLLTRIVKALDRKDFGTASQLQIEMQEKVEELRNLYIIYKKNLF